MTATPTHDRTAAEPTASAHSGPHPVTRVAGPVALVVGSAMAVVGQGLHVADTGDELAIVQAIADASGAWMASHLLLGFGFALIAIGAVTALPRHRGRGAALLAAGGLVLPLGAAVMALGDAAHGALGHALVGTVDVPTSLDIHTAYFDGAMAPVLNLGAPLLTVGMILLGTGLIRSRRYRAWYGLVVAASPIVVLAGFNLGLPSFLNLAPMAVGLTVLAVALVQGPTSAPGATARPRGSVTDPAS
jgi:hypothetical protein